ncbi:hypothetical protein Q3C01_40250 [Bradyrhizobium sp. UFLA05-109]
MTTYVRTSILCTIVTLVLWSAAAAPSQADTGTLRVIFGKGGLITAAGAGRGVLTFHSKQYPFEASGATVGATLGVSTSEFGGRAFNLRTPSDLAGSYTGLGVGAALGAGAGWVRLRNENGVVLVLRGPKIGVEAYANWGWVRIDMK